MHLVSKACILFFRVSKQVHCFTALEGDGDDKRLVKLLNMLAKLMVLHRQIPFSLGIAEAILMRTSAVHANICTDVVRAVADFHSTCRCSVYKSVGEVL